jgi:hypothetical protein
MGSQPRPKVDVYRPPSNVGETVSPSIPLVAFRRRLLISGPFCSLRRCHQLAEMKRSAQFARHKGNSRDILRTFAKRIPAHLDSNQSGHFEMTQHFEKSNLCVLHPSRMEINHPMGNKWFIQKYSIDSP